MEIKETNNNQSKDLNENIEEDIINNLLSDAKLKYPTNIFNIFVREKFNEEKKNTNCNIKYDVKKYKKMWDELTEEEKEKYKILQLYEKNKYKRDKEIIKQFIFKGLDGKVKIKSTAYQIFVSDKLIEGLEKGIDPKFIKEKAKDEWKKMNITEKNKYKNRKKENDTILDLVIKYKHINPFILFVFEKLEFSKKNKLNIPSISNLIKDWKTLTNSNKKKYEVYSNEFINYKYKVRDLYEAIYGIKPKKPSGALRIFLQIKALNKEIDSINEGIEKWKELTEDEKDEYLKMSHNYYLAYKYKELLHRKKIKRIFPKKPTGPFQFFLIDKKGIKIPEGYNTINYWRNIFNNLSDEEQEKYINEYNIAKEKYYKKMEYFNDKIFDLPKKPKKAFTYYVAYRFEQIYKNNKNFNVKENFEIIAKEWAEDNIDKKRFQLMENQDKHRFKTQVYQFEKYGYYNKIKSGEENEEENDDKDEEIKENNKSIYRKKKLSSVSNDKNKPKKKSLSNYNNKKNC